MECSHEYSTSEGVMSLYFRSRSCGVEVCSECNDHKGLARCYCGWSLSGRSGYQELIEMGENIEEDY